MKPRIASALLLAVVAACAIAQSGQAPKDDTQSLEGCWEGILGGQLHIVVIFSNAPSGYNGSLVSVDQGSVLPITSATLQGSAVQFEVKRVGGSYKGTLNAAGDEIRGSWTQTAAPAPQPLNLKRKAAAQTSASPSSSPSAAAAQPKPAEHRTHTPKPFSAPLDVAVPAEPWAFQAAGKWHLVYELHITNFDSFDCSLTRIEVLSADRAAAKKSFADLSGAALAAILRHPGQPETNANASSGAPDNLSIAPGSLAVAFLWITLDSHDDIPAALTHRISVRVGDYPEAIQTETPPLNIIRKPVVVIAPPLRGSDWVAANGPSNTSFHRRALLTVNGRSFISQRFATDWLQVNSDGQTHAGDAADNKNYRAYGAEIYAVSDGTVTEIKDGLPQNIPGPNSRAIPITLETVGGNHIIQQIGENLFAFYAHLQPGSLRVKAGDTVHRGDVIALLGNSGNSTEPHLHFDICNASSMLACEGVPFAFTSYQLEGHGPDLRVPTMVTLTGGPQTAMEARPAPLKHEADLPLEFDIVRFLDKT